MWVYRNTCEISLFEIEERIKYINKLNPLDYTVFTSVYGDYWVSEDELIKRIRQTSGYIFNYVSDNRIKESLFDLYKREYLIREEIEVDREPTEIELRTNPNEPMTISVGNC